ncbi:MAG: DUF3822 family protein [Parabacteroides sp.]|nr:DUF3822 family protein [Parabacteroides sp.]
MAFELSDKITVDQSENYIMSIRLGSDGLSFSVYNPSERDSFLYRKVVLERGKSYISFLKDFFFENEFLSWSYKKVYVVFVSSPYTIVPQEFYQEKKKNELLTFTASLVENVYLNNSLKEERAELVFGVNDEVYEFCSRSLIKPIFVHHLTPIFTFLGRSSRLHLSKKMFVVVHRRSVDVVCYEQGHLSFSNTFEYKCLEDVVYYLLYIWKQLGMDQLTDQLSLFGETSFCHTVIKVLRDYIQSVELLEIPSEAYLLGTEIVHSPLDLIALSLCEL